MSVPACVSIICSVALLHPLFLCLDWKLQCAVSTCPWSTAPSLGAPDWPSATTHHAVSLRPRLVIPTTPCYADHSVSLQPCRVTPNTWTPLWAISQTVYFVIQASVSFIYCLAFSLRGCWAPPHGSPFLARFVALRQAGETATITVDV